jgi:hypothetical protein
METFESRARRGARLLDRNARGWATGISRERLDLGSCQQCVLAQLFGDYTSGLNTLRIMVICGDDIRFGFATDEPNGDEYPQLTTAWRREITKRLPVAVVDVVV